MFGRVPAHLFVLVWAWGDINIKNYMCVEKAKHTFSNGLYTMDLYLSGIRGEFSA